MDAIAALAMRSYRYSSRRVDVMWFVSMESRNDPYCGKLFFSSVFIGPTRNV